MSLLPPPRRRSARHRMWGAWLALPEVLRMAAVLIALVALAWFSG